MSETRIVDVIEFVDKSSRVRNLKIRLRMTALQFGIRHSANKPDALQNRATAVYRCMHNIANVCLLMRTCQSDYQNQPVWEKYLSIDTTLNAIVVALTPTVSHDCSKLYCLGPYVKHNTMYDRLDHSQYPSEWHHN